MLHLERGINARAQLNLGWASVDLYFFSRNQEGEVTHEAREPIVFEPIESRNVEMSPTIRLTEEAAQQLSEDLWGAGVRPKSAQSRDEEVNALQAHIADLQKLIFETQDERIPKAVLEPLLKFATSAADRVLTPEGPSLDPR